MPVLDSFSFPSAPRQYTDDEKRNIVRNAGYDPAKYDYHSESDSLVPRLAQAPTEPALTTPAVSSMAEPSTTGSTFGGAARREFGRSVAPALAASGAVAAGAAPIAAGLGLSSTGLGATIGIPLILGGLAAYGTRKAQAPVIGAVLGDEKRKAYEEQERQDFESQRLATVLGGLASAPVGGFNPSPANLGRAITSVPKALLQHELNPADLANLKNVAVGTGSGAAGSFVPALVEGKDALPSIGDILLGAASGGVFNRPNVIGKRAFGFKDPAEILANRPTNPDFTGVQDFRSPEAEVRAQVGKQAEINNRIEVERQLAEMDRAKQARDAQIEVQRRVEAQMEKEHQANLHRQASTKLGEGIASQEGSGAGDARKSALNIEDLSRGQRVLEGFEEGKLNKELQVRYDEQEARKAQSAQRQSEFEAALEEQRTAEVELAKTKAEVARREAEELKAKKIDLAIGGKTGVEAEELSPAQRLQEAIQKRQILKSQGEDEAGLPAREVFADTTETVSDDEANLAAQHGVSGIEVVPRGEITTQEGKPAAGQIDMETGKIKVSTFRDETGGGGDTLFHETLHKVYENLKDYDAAHAQRLFKRAVELVGDKGNAPEEGIIGEAGRRAVELQQSRKGESPSKLTQAKLFWQDLVSGTKITFGGGNEQDISRILARRLLDAPNYYESGAALKGGAPAGVRNVAESGKKSQPEEESSLPAQEPTAPKYAPVVYKGKQAGFPEGGLPDFHLYNLTADVPGTPLVKGSTITEKTMQKYGLEIPPTEKVKEGGEGIKSQTETEAAKTPLPSYTKKELSAKRGVNNLITSRFDKVATKLKSPTGNYLSERFNKFDADKDILTGRIANRLIASGKGLSPESLQRIHRYRWEVDNSMPPTIKLTSAEGAANNRMTQIFKETREYQNTLGLKVQDGQEFRAGGISPKGYQPNMASSEYVHSLVNHTPERIGFMRQHEAWLVKRGMKKDEAAQVVEDYANQIGNAGVTPSIRFGALRKAEGLGLPYELIEPNLNALFLRYGKRAANDLSFYKNLQADPKARKALNLADQTGSRDYSGIDPSVESVANAPEVKEALRSVYGIDYDTQAHPVLEASKRVVSGLVMGPGTALRNLANLPGIISPYKGALTHAIPALSRMSERAGRAFESNAVRADFSELEKAGNLAGSPDRVVKVMDNLANGLRKWQGRNLSDKFEAEFLYSLGEDLSQFWIAGAKRGDIESRRLLNRFGRDSLDIAPEKLWSKGFKPTEEHITQLAKSFVDGTRGTYGPRGLPSGAIEGQIAPFLSLQRFGIEKANTIYKDVWLPMKEGNFAPFLTYSGMSLLVGAGIEQLNELLSNKRGPDATIKETLVAGEAEDVAAKLVGLAQMASYFGIVSDFAKFGVTAAQGKDVKYSNPLSFPLYSVLVEDVGQNLAFWVKAMSEGEDPIDTTAALMSAIAKGASQSFRYLNAHAIEPEEAERKESFRDKRVFDELTGVKDPVAFAPTNPFLGAEDRKFKRTASLTEAGALLPGLVSKKVAKAGTDRERLSTSLRGLKANSFQTFPSPESSPQQAAKYFSYLVETQGREAANKALEKYLLQVQVNKRKSELVPDF